MFALLTRMWCHTAVSQATQTRPEIRLKGLYVMDLALEASIFPKDDLRIP